MQGPLLVIELYITGAIIIKLKAQPQNITTIQVYAPTTHSEKYRTWTIDR
jgi:hypothetical protein